jgi:hypothetical protein
VFRSVSLLLTWDIGGCFIDISFSLSVANLRLADFESSRYSPERGKLPEIRGYVALLNYKQSCRSF